MASSDDFREHIKAGNITEALVLALGEATELKITTWVSKAADEVEIADAKPGHRLQTRINMLSGDIENELGDQFLGNGPYREIRQFHLEQVALGNQIIKSNLKSLQKLFEVLIALRYPDATTPVIESELIDVESQRLPPAGDVTNAELVIEPNESVIEESVVTPNSLTGENFTEIPLPPSQTPDSLLTTPTDSREALQEQTDEDEDDWDESVLDLLESLPSEAPDTRESLDSDNDTDWRELLAEEPSPDSATSNLSGDLAWGTLSREDFDSPPTSPEANITDKLENLVAEEPSPDSITSNLPTDQDLGILPREDVSSPPTSATPNIEASIFQLDEDWGDMVEDESQPSSNQFPVIESLGLSEDEEWDEWVIEESAPLENALITDTNSFNLSEDDDWDEFEEDADPFASIPTPSESASELGIDQEWDEFEADERKPSSEFIDINTNVGANFEDYDFLEELTPEESEQTATSNDDLEANQKPVEKRVPPPPPPPGRLTNDNN